MLADTKRSSTEPVAAPSGPLEKAMGNLLTQYDRLAALARVRMDAMRRADSAGLAACISQENEAVSAIAEIEKQRLRIVGELAQRLGSREGVSTTVAWIAERLEHDARERLLEAAQSLRTRMSEVRELNRVGATVAERLARHMEGLWAQVAASMNHSKTYGRMGAMPAGPRVMSALDLTS